MDKLLFYFISLLAAKIQKLAYRTGCNLLRETKRSNSRKLAPTLIWIKARRTAIFIIVAVDRLKFLYVVTSGLSAALI
jgi:hypothetical protein